MTRYDVIVVGAGVAGSLVAHRLGRSAGGSWSWRRAPRIPETEPSTIR